MRHPPATFNSNQAMELLDQEQEQELPLTKLEVPLNQVEPISLDLEPMEHQA